MTEFNSGWEMGGFDFMERIFPILFIGVFLIIFFTVIVGIVRSLFTFFKNNSSPVLHVPAKIVTKRTEVSHHHHNNTHDTTSTTYYVTFQVESGDRIEFRLKGREYGLLAEGDYGKLTFQGTRYLSFQQENNYKI